MSFKICTKCGLSKSEEEFRIRSDNDKRHKSCKKCQREYSKKYRKNNLEFCNKISKEYYHKNKDKINENRNKEKAREYQKEWCKNKRKTDPIYKMKKNMSRAIRAYLNGNKNGRKTEDILGYTISELKEHIENQFNENINWENYGEFWSIDHIIPVSLYDFNNNDEIKKCWNKKNLRPLERIKNIKKGNDLDMKLIKEYNLEELLPVNTGGK